MTLTKWEKELGQLSAMKAYWESGRIAPCILAPVALDGGEWSASRLGRFTPRKRAPRNWIGAWVGLRAGLDTVVKRKNSQPLPGLEISALFSVISCFGNI
jgi:hypothetical protein